MKILLTLTVGALLASPLLLRADDATNSPPPGPPPGEGMHHHHDMLAGLSDSDRAKMKKAYDAAMAADPTLATEQTAAEDKMKASHDAGTPPTKEDHEAMKAFHDKLDAAMIKVDPAVAPIIAKLKAAHHKHGPDEGAPPPPPPDSGT